MTDAGRLRGRVLGAASIIAPTAVYVVAFRWLGNRLGPDYTDPFPAPTGFAPPSATLIASDLAAREAFVLAATAMLMISCAALAYAITGMARTHGRGGLVAGVLAALFSGAVAIIDEGNPFRTFLVDRALTAATKAGALFAPERTPDAFADFITLNTFIGIGAVGAMMLRFAALCHFSGASPSGAAELTQRNAAARTSLMVGGLILTSAAATTYFFYHYPVALMEGDARLTQQSLASIASTRWGAVYTAVLIATAAPTFAAIHLDARDAVDRGEVTEDDARALLSPAAVFGGPLKALGALGAALAPAAIGPMLGLLEPILKLHGG